MDGYAPLFAYVGTEGWLLDLELRPGVQHSQKGAPEFFRGCVDKLRVLGILDRCLVRLDSGHDAKDSIDVLRGQCDFIIKRNLRKEFPEWWLQHAKRLGTATTTRMSEPTPGPGGPAGDLLGGNRRASPWKEQFAPSGNRKKGPRPKRTPGRGSEPMPERRISPCDALWRESCRIAHGFEVKKSLAPDLPRPKDGGLFVPLEVKSIVKLQTG